MYVSYYLTSDECYKIVHFRNKNKAPFSKKRGVHVGNPYYLLNCSASVDPFNAVVEEVPPDTTMDTWSK